MELEFVEGNSRARALYEKMNFAGCLALEQAKQRVVNERENKVRRNAEPRTTTNPQYRK